MEKRKTAIKVLFISILMAAALAFTYCCGKKPGDESSVVRDDSSFCFDESSNDWAGHYAGDILVIATAEIIDIPSEETTTEVETTEEQTTTSETTESTTKKSTTAPTNAPIPEKKTTKTTTTTTITTKTETTTKTVVSETKKTVTIVYKPSTHYFHTSECRWYDNSCTEDYDLNDVYGRLCTECKPDVTLVHTYEPPKQETKVSNNSSLPITQSEFIMLANLVAHEYGADWVPTAEKAKVVMTVMNRVHSSKYPNNVKDVILQKNQYCWVPSTYYWKRTTQGCKDAVTYYFQHQGDYSKNLYSFWGDGWKNHFY